LNPDYLLYAGAAGVLLGLIFFLVFLYRRFMRLIGLISGERGKRRGILAGLRSMALIFLWTSVFGIILFFGLFLRAYHGFTHEQPVARVITHPLNTHKGPAAQVTFVPIETGSPRYFIVKGDQWMVEGDVIKWHNWLNFMGLHTRYRLTRLRGRYVGAEAERSNSPSIYALTTTEHHPLWQHLYEFGQRLPLVDTVYGSAGFQTSATERCYVVSVSKSGFVIREEGRS